MTGRFFRGAFVEDEESVVDTISVRCNPKYPTVPWSPVVSLNGTPLKGVQELIVGIHHEEFTTVTIKMLVHVELDIPVVEVPEGEE